MVEISSVGILNEYFVDRTNERVKGFFLEPIESEVSLDNIIKGFDEQFKHNVDRVTARIFLTNKLLPYLRDNLKSHLEAIVPLDGEFKELSLIYLGKNVPSRYEKKGITYQEIKMADEINSTDRVVDYDTSILKVTSKNFSVNIEDTLSIKDEERLVAIYKKSFSDTYLFEMNLENVQKLTRNKNNIKAIARNNNEIVSIGVGEFKEFKVDNKNFKLVELSDAATDTDYMNNGLYTATCALLMKKFYKRKIDLIYGEARAAHKGVNIACKTSGRNLYGMLHKHCKIGGPKTINETGPYENLNVWAITFNSLSRICNGGRK